MPRSKHGFCPLHLIGYNRSFDATCPQCLMARINPPKQLDYDAAAQTPIDAAGKPVDVESIQV